MAFIWCSSWLSRLIGSALQALDQWRCWNLGRFCPHRASQRRLSRTCCARAYMFGERERSTACLRDQGCAGLHYRQVTSLLSNGRSDCSLGRQDWFLTGGLNSSALIKALVVRNLCLIFSALRAHTLTSQARDRCLWIWANWSDSAS